ncbi:hypothetical protein O181_085508 [Austropuccinia psidii MF-1]|uniref:Reverse transcriptase Ty1/copia-type domain-containing protein n=1 Tax=Austropuccinia psidii MF-1 TaxID=1389203 RepID=A0A9Q3FT89_9BASI|nr:hypothetical protein [Austropuccinia psidii MF-1]
MAKTPPPKPSSFLLLPLTAPEAETVEKLGTSESEAIDEVHSDYPTSLQDESDVLFIGPRHPSLISSDINPKNVPLYPRRSQALITSEDKAPSTFKGALQSPEKEQWGDAIRKELSSVAKLEVWDFMYLDPGFELVGTTWVFKLKTISEMFSHKKLNSGPKGLLNPLVLTLEKPTHQWVALIH